MITTSAKHQETGTLCPVETCSVRVSGFPDGRRGGSAQVGVLMIAVRMNRRAQVATALLSSHGFT